MGQLRLTLDDLDENGSIGDWCFMGEHGNLAPHAYLCLKLPNGEGNSGDVAVLPIAPDALRPRWSWNGSETAPTLTPSILHHGSGQPWHGYLTDGRLVPA